MRAGQKITIVIAVVLALVIGGGAFWLYRHYASSEADGGPGTSVDGIIKYELQTPEYFDDRPQDAQFRIRSEDDLAEFYNLYSDKLNVNAEYLKNNDIFIKVQSASSGSIKYSLSDVIVKNNKLVFVIDSQNPTMGTADMAFWYFVAVIPKDKLNFLNLDDWEKPHF